jgi:hypothetical protein
MTGAKCGASGSRRVERLGNGVDKNGESIADPDSHPLCYKVKRA